MTSALYDRGEVRFHGERWRELADLAETAFAKVRRLNAPLGWAALYLACGLIVVQLQPAGTPPLLYPPIAIGIAFLLRAGMRYWPLVLAADLIISFALYGHTADSLVAAVCTTLEAACAALALRGRRPGFGISDHRDLAWLALACAGATFTGASLGAALLDVVKGAHALSWSAWLSWWIGDAASSISLLPLILVFTERPRSTARPAALSWEHGATLGAAVAIAYAAFGHLPPVPTAIQEAVEPLIFGPVLWAALRLGARATCGAILATAIAVVLFRWSSGFAAADASILIRHEVLEIQCYLVAITIVGLALSLALDRERSARVDAESREAQLRQAAEDLRATSTRLALAAKAGNVGVWDWSLEDNGVIWDDQVYEMYQVDRNIADNYQAWLQRLHPEDRARLLEEFDRSAKRGEEMSSHFRILLPDGEVRHFNTHCVVQESKGGKVTRVIGIDYDVTELVRQRLRAEESEVRAEAANRAKSEFLAIMSHELRTPLNAIIGFSDLMAREAFGPLQNQRYADYVADIRTSGHMLLSLINDILDLTRIEAGKLELNPEPIDPGEIMGGIVRQLSPLAEGKYLRLSAENAAGCRPALADRRALRQLLNNLVANSIKFTDAGGAVTLSAEMVNGQSMALIISDNGRGIPRERIADLCKPFVQIADPLRRDVGGIGLGLAISRSLAEAMGGTLSIESDLGQGTTVRVELPAA